MHEPVIEPMAVRAAKLPEPMALKKGRLKAQRAKKREEMLEGEIDQGVRDMDDAISRRRK